LVLFYEIPQWYALKVQSRQEKPDGGGGPPALVICFALCAAWGCALLWGAAPTLREAQRISLAERIGPLKPGQKFFPQEFELSADGRYIALSYEVLPPKGTLADPEAYITIVDLDAAGGARSVVTCKRVARGAFVGFLGSSNKVLTDNGYTAMMLEPHPESKCRPLNLNSVAHPRGTKLSVDYGAATDRADFFVIAVKQVPDEEHAKSLPAGRMDLPPPRLLFFEKGTERFVGECRSPLWVSKLLLSPGGKYVAVLDRFSGATKFQPGVSVVDTSTCELVSAFALPAVPHSVAFFPDERRIASSLISNKRDAAIEIWDIKTGRALQSIRDPQHGTSGAFKISPDGRFIAVHTTRERPLLYKEGTKIVNGGFQLWHVRPGRMIGEVRFQPENNWLANLTFTADGQCIVVLTSDLVLHFYEVPSLE
jgi:hypothetical protein